MLDDTILDKEKKGIRDVNIVDNVNVSLCYGVVVVAHAQAGCVLFLPRRTALHIISKRRRPALFTLPVQLGCGELTYRD